MEVLRDTNDGELFREWIRSWLEANCPDSMRTPMVIAEAPWGGAEWPNPEAKLWLDRAASEGLTLPTVPQEYGGAGLTPWQAEIYWEELHRIGGRIPHTGVGPLMLAPTIQQFGTEEQKRRFLPPIAHASVRWCQGFSEPGAGSDLASLQLRADKDGDDYVLNGQKIWNSNADCSDWMIVLARTNRRENHRQFGISFLLVDLSSPGITIRPLRLISGKSEFCETFFDDVRVPVSNRIGPEDEGWNVTKHFLVHDRYSALHWPREDHGISLPHLWSDITGRPELWHPVAASELDELGVEEFKNRIARLNGEGIDVSHFAAVLKYWEMEHVKRRYELALRLVDERGLGWSGEIIEEQDQERVRQSLFARANSIGGGSSEIMLNIISKRVLQLPES